MSDSAPGKAPQAGKAQADTAQTTAETGAAGTDPAQAGDEQAHASSASDAGTDGDGAKPDMDEVKRKFREALDRKQEIHAEGSGPGRDSGKIHGPHDRAGSRRQFRRKSG